MDSLVDSCFDTSYAVYVSPNLTISATLNKNALYCKIKKNDVVTIQVVDVATKAQYGNVTVPYNNSDFSFQIQNSSINGTPQLLLNFIVLNQTLDYLLVN